MAQENADGRILTGQPHLAVVVVDVHLHLSDVLMLQVAALEIDKDKALKNPVEEHEGDAEVTLVERDALLASDEGEALAEFEHELLNVVDQLRLKVRL